MFSKNNRINIQQTYEEITLVFKLLTNMQTLPKALYFHYNRITFYFYNKSVYFWIQNLSIKFTSIHKHYIVSFVIKFIFYYDAYILLRMLSLKIK